MLTAQLLVHSAQCMVEGITSSCDWLSLRLISHEQQVWLAFLATKRDVWVVPTANCGGYARRRREDSVSGGRNHTMLLFVITTL